MFNGTLDPVSNRETWFGAFTFLDEETGDPIDISNVSAIVLEVMDNGSAVLSGSLGDEISHGETGQFTWEFSATSMRALDPKTYKVGATLTQNSQTVQILIGTLPVLDGVVS